MASKSFSVTRTKATWKPRVSADDLPILECESCHELYLRLGVEPAFLTDPGRNPVFNLPYATQATDEATCCGEKMRCIEALSAEELPAGVRIDYAILGGYNNNAIEVSWDIGDPSYSLRWVALKTFTGFQVKYLTPGKRSPLMFALADEDAYVYCDENPCLECVFMCKRGFVLYCMLEGLGLVRIPLERSSAHWESRK